MKKLLIPALIFLIVIVTGLWVGKAHAITNDRYLDADGLTDVQKAELATSIAKLKEKSKNQITEAPTVQKVNQWVELGANLGKGLASTAKELGVAANDFVKTPVGKVTAFIIIYKFVGRDIVHFVVGSLFFIVIGGSWMYAFRRVCLMNEINYNEELKEGKILKRKVIRYKNWKNDVDGIAILIFLLSGMVIVGLGLIIIFP